MKKMKKNSDICCVYLTIEFIKMRIFLLLFFVEILFVTLSKAQSVAAPGEALNNDSLVRVGSLENGLRYYLRQNVRLDRRTDIYFITNRDSVINDRSYSRLTDVQAVIVVGDIDVDKEEETMQRLYAHSPPPLVDTLCEKVKNDVPMIHIETDPSARNTSIAVAYKHTSIPLKIRSLGASYLRDMIRQLVLDMLLDRLEEAALKPYTPYLSAFGSYAPIDHATDAFRVAVTAKEGVGLLACSALLEELERVRRFGFEESELERAKVRMIRQWEHRAANDANRDNIEFSSQYVAHFLHNKPYLTPTYEWEVVKGYMPFIRLAQVNESARELIADEKISISSHFPQKAGITAPAEIDFLQSMSSIKRTRLAPYSEQISSAPLMDATKLKGGKIVREEEGRFGSVVWVLDNGVRVVIKPTAFKRDEVVFRTYTQGGTSTVATSDIPSAYFALTPFFPVSGVSLFTTTELNKKTAGKIVSVLPYISMYEQGFYGSSSPVDIETMLQLLYLRMALPRFVESEFVQVMFQIQNLENQLICKEFNNLIYNGDNPRRPTPNEEALQKIDFSAMERVYHALLGAADGMTMVLVGNIEPNVVRPLIEKYAGSFPVNGVSPAWRDEGIYPQRGEIKHALAVAKDEHKVTIHQLYHGELRNTLKNKLTMRALTQIMETTYHSIKVTETIEPRPAHLFWLTMQWETDPEHFVERAEQAQESLRHLAAQGPANEQLQAAKEGILMQFYEDQYKNEYWQSLLLHYFCDDIDYYTDFEETVREISVESIKELAANILSQNNLITMIITPDHEE